MQVRAWAILAAATTACVDTGDSMINGLWWQQGQVLGLAGISAAGLAATCIGCGSDTPPASIYSPPTLAITVADKTPPAAPVCTNFDQDLTGGQVLKHKQITIRNTQADVGAAPAKLCLKWEATKTNTQFKVTVLSGGDQKDDAYCTNSETSPFKPGTTGLFAIPVNGKPLVLDVEYKGNESGDSDPVTITISSNSKVVNPKTENPNVRKICFGIAKVGACGAIFPSEYYFANATKANPPTQCFGIKNCGTAALAFKGADFETANAQYQIVQQPNAEDAIAPKGDPANPDGQKEFKVCVRYSPDDSPDNEDVILVVSTNATTDNGKVKALISHKTEAEAKWKVDCSDPTGKLGFFFPEAEKAGKKTCKVVNDGPPPLKIQNVAAVPVQSNDEEAVNAALKCKLVDIAGTAHDLYSVGPGKSADLVCEYTPQGAGKPPAAVASFSYGSAGGNNGTMTLPILVGGCTAPSPEFGPTELWQMAKPGESSTGNIAVANQSCAGMQLVTACIAPASYKGNEPCQAPSKSHSLEPAFAPMSVPAYGVTTLKVKFAPDAKATTKQVSDLLHVSYCNGLWASDKCQGTIVTRAINLTGAVAFDDKVVPPTVACTLGGDAANLTKGNLVTIQAGAKGGATFDNQTFYYRFVVSSRPAGATSWISEVQQSTDQQSWTKLLPDQPGAYEVLCQVQGVKTDDAATYAWSSQVPVQFTVK
ncbi:MAG: hypothetical protein FJ100_10880 [Deltaproteobacteria bacterium]|nr:hypothetical protein [Deltaproteobacteria bacterium]